MPGPPQPLSDGTERARKNDRPLCSMGAPIGT